MLKALVIESVIVESVRVNFFRKLSSTTMREREREKERERERKRERERERYVLSR